MEAIPNITEQTVMPLTRVRPCTSSNDFVGALVGSHSHEMAVASLGLTALLGENTPSLIASFRGFAGFGTVRFN